MTPPNPAPSAATAAAPASAPAAAPARPIPFTGSAHHHRELVNQSTFTLSGAIQPVPQPIPVTAYGYLRYLLVDVAWTGGVAGTLGTDAPFNFLTNVYLQDVNGSNLQYPIDGFGLLQENIFGGYGGARVDPRQSPIFTSGPTAGRFMIRVPVEINPRSGLGSLANQSAAEEYKFIYSVNASTAIYSAAPTTMPTVTVRTYLEAWTQPESADMFGRPQADVPPRHGTASYHTQFTPSLVVGQNQVPITRMGNLIRFILCISRDTTGARNDGVFPDPFQLLWDGNVLTSESAALRQHLSYEILPPTTNRDTGVFVFPFNTIDHGQVGWDDPNLWLPTVQSTRMELDGPAATAGTIQFIVNDIAPAEVNPQRRYVQTSATGRLQHPDLAAA